MSPATALSSVPPGAATAGLVRNYGGFRLGDLHLALPMNALREIVPCDTLVPMRGTAACIAGGIERGKSLIPVVDLRSALGQSLDGPPATRVLLLMHDGVPLGLLAHDVTGVLPGPAIMLDPSTPASRHASPLINGHLPLGNGRNLRILSLDTLAALPKVGAVRKPARRPLTLPVWLGALTSVWRRNAPAPGWGTASAQMSGTWDTAILG